MAKKKKVFCVINTSIDFASDENGKDEFDTLDEANALAKYICEDRREGAYVVQLLVSFLPTTGTAKKTY